MTTMNMSILSPATSPSRTLVQAVRDARLWVKETPAPRWEGGAAAKATFAGYIGGSIVVWTLLGTSTAAILGLVLKAVA